LPNYPKDIKEMQNGEILEKQAPTTRHLEIIKEEEEFVERVKSVLKTALSQKTYHEDYKKQLNELQEALKTVKNEDVASIYNEYHLLESKAKRDRDIRNILPSLESPYFAHMRLKEDHGSRDIFLGHQSYISSKDKVVIINWKDAPISRIFFAYKEGESFEEDLPGGRVITGELEARRILTIVNGNLVGIKLPDVSFQKTHDGKWISSEQVLPHLSGGEGTATRGYLGTGQTGIHRPEVSALLDTEQFELLHMEEETPLMILGGAGSGKTTVALHRLAALVHKDTKKYASDRIVAIVPEKGLVRLSQKILANLGIENVEIATYDYWVAKQARRVAQNFPRKICDFTPLSVIKFKRHKALLDIIPEYIDLRRKDIANRITELFPEHTKYSEHFLSQDDSTT
jgi:DNA helicase-2/ATP-dependent DNA helicase PcrA